MAAQEDSTAEKHIHKVYTMTPYNYDIEEVKFLVLNPYGTPSFEDCQVLSFDDIYREVVKKMRQDGIIPFEGED